MLSVLDKDRSRPAGFRSVGWLLAGTLVVGGCASSPPPKPTAYQPTALVSQVNALEAELRELRNKVEEQQFELENLKRRQQENQMGMLQQSQIANPGDQTQMIGQDAATGMMPPMDGAGDMTDMSQIPAGQVQSGDTTAMPTAPVANEPTAVETATPAPAPLELQSAPTAEQSTYDAAFDFLRQGRYEEAIGGFQGFVDTYPASQLADDAYYWMSEARYVSRQFEEALKGFKTVVARYPESQRVPEALLKVGYIQYDIGAYSDAAQTFRDLMTQFPSHPAAGSAESRLKRIESNTN